MDFYKIREKVGKDGKVYLTPGFRVSKTQDLMVRAKSVYAVWDSSRNMWSRDEYAVARLVDESLWRRAEEIRQETGVMPIVNTMEEFSSGVWTKFKNFVSALSDCYTELDTKLTWADTVVTKEDYVSRRLPYSLSKLPAPAYDELMSTIYDPEEREKIEWAVGSIVHGDSQKIQKFMVFYGEPGSGKSTIMNIISSLFEGYGTVFEARALVGQNQFATAAFQNNPLVAIQHDGDLSRIEDNTKLNSISSHEEIIINEKNKPAFSLRLRAFMFMGTNKPVKITDSRSGLIRRLIDVVPSGRLLTPQRYHTIMGEIPFELGSIAQHCLDVYLRLGKNRYEGYKPRNMMRTTNVMFDFVDSHWETFISQPGVTLKQAYTLYKEFCEESGLKLGVSKQQFREDLKPYFGKYKERHQMGGERLRDVYLDFKQGSLYGAPKETQPPPAALNLDETESLLDGVLSEMPAQYGNDNETPSQKWVNVGTTLKDLDTKKLHYVKVPEGHIVIDFDLKDESGNKSLEMNLKAASEWPPTYSELSKGRNGVHLHYYYDGDTSRLSRVYSEGIEVKVFSGDSSLRRRVSRCNKTPIAHIAGGLPLKEASMAVDFNRVADEKHLRRMIEKNLRKEIHPNTAPSIDFIKKLLDDAYSSGMVYDVENMKEKVFVFATLSTNQSDHCLKQVMKMKFKSDVDPEETPGKPENDDIVFFDVEVFPNLVVLCYKTQGRDGVVKMINPSSSDVETLMKNRLVGFNCRRYDNHILYGIFLGWSVSKIYELSQDIINNRQSAMFGEAYNLSYTDIYDFSSVKQSLKKFEIDLGIHHMELGLPWDEPVPEDLWPRVAEYCANDVIATEAVFNARKADWKARLMLSALSGLSPNSSTQQHTARIMFGSDRDAKSKFHYTNLATGEVM